MAQQDSRRTDDVGEQPRSPLKRAPEQPPCSSSAEGLVLNGLFAVPARMGHFDPTPHLVFAEHRAIWRSMRRVSAGDHGGWWWRTFCDLRSAEGDRAWHLLHVLTWSAQGIVDDSDNGCLAFMLAWKALERCTEARRRIQMAQEQAERAWRVPDVPYTADEKRRMLGRLDVGVDIP